MIVRQDSDNRCHLASQASPWNYLITAPPRKYNRKTRSDKILRPLNYLSKTKSNKPFSCTIIIFNVCNHDLGGASLAFTKFVFENRFQPITLDARFGSASNNQINYMKKSIILSSFVIFFLAGCATAKINKYSKQAEPNLAMNYTVGTIYIFDKRKNVATEEMRLPIFSYPGMETKYQPPLDPNREIIAEVIKSNFTGKGKKINVTVYLEEGLKAFLGGFFTEKETTVVSVIIEAKDEDNYVLASTGGESIEVNSMDAKNKRLERQFQVTLKNAVFKGLKETKTLNCFLRYRHVVPVAH